MRHTSRPRARRFSVDRDEKTSDFAARLGLRLAAARLSAGLTQAELGERIGRRHQAVSRYERGLSVPPVVTLKMLSEILGASVGALLGTNES